MPTHYLCTQVNAEAGEQCTGQRSTSPSTHTELNNDYSDYNDYSGLVVPINDYIACLIASESKMLIAEL